MNSNKNLHKGNKIPCQISIKFPSLCVLMFFLCKSLLFLVLTEMIYSTLARASQQKYLLTQNQLQLSKCLNVILVRKNSTTTLDKLKQVQSPANALLVSPRLSIQTELCQSRYFTTNMLLKADAPASSEQKENTEPKKKPSKFKIFYTQYGPIFLVVHFTTVVMWIYGFFLISKQYLNILKTCFFVVECCLS